MAIATTMLLQAFAGVSLYLPWPSTKSATSPRALAMICVWQVWFVIHSILWPFGPLPSHLCHVPLSRYLILRAQVVDVLAGPVVPESLHPGYKARLSLKPLTGELASSLNEQVLLWQHGPKLQCAAFLMPACPSPSKHRTGCPLLRFWCVPRLSWPHFAVPSEPMALQGSCLD